MAPRPRATSANLRGREPIYLAVFLLMVVYHHYSAHSTILLHSLPVTPPYNEGSSLPFMNTATTQHRADDAGPVRIPLDMLTTSSISTCPPPLIYLPNHVRTETRNRKIPKIIHMTSKSRCFTSNFYDNIQQWHHMEEHSLYLHDDAAVDRLLSQDWPLFPHMNLARKCLRSGAGLADLWRYVVLWEYGGIYTDIDNAPGKYWTADTIQDDDDAFFVIETLGVLSQYFMAVSPKHPLMYLCILLSLHRILAIDHVGKQNVPLVTGPGALKVAFKYFMRTHQLLDQEDEKQWKRSHPNATRYGRVKAGKYYGVGNRSVTVVGTKDTGSRWVVRGSVQNKGMGYDAMGMRHFSVMAKKKFNESCLVHLWNLQFDFDNFNSTNW